MVQDPRVSVLLHRLGGLYRDPVRVDRDASSLLKSSVGVHLNPGIANLVENNGQTSRCLVLQGTIAMVFRGVTYQLLIDMFLPPGYPVRPPICYVRLANPNMYLKENHAHVGRDGMVYLPYLSEWKQQSHNLVELVVAMSSVFSADPPVFTRSTAAAPTASLQQPNTNSASASPVPPQQHKTTTTGSTSTTTGSTTFSSLAAMSSSLATAMSASRRQQQSPRLDDQHDAAAALVKQQQQQQQQEAEARLAKEAEEANRAAEIARALEQQELEQERLRLAQLEWDQQQHAKTKARVQAKLQERLQKLILQETKQRLQEDMKDQQLLQRNQVRLQEQEEYWRALLEKLQRDVQDVDEKTIQIQAWLADVKEQQQQQNNNNKENSAAATSTDEISVLNVDEIVVSRNKRDDQVLRLEAENAALTDILYFLDRRMFARGGGGTTTTSSSTTMSTSTNAMSSSSNNNNNSMDCTNFLKQVRQLAKRQFIVRAHLIKIRQSF